MNLLNYTKTLYKKINFYDHFLKNTNFESSGMNPFLKNEPFNITIIWAEDNNGKSN